MELNVSIIDDLIRRHPTTESIREKILNASACLIDCYLKGGKVLICGNGGSSSDSDHIAGELLKGFESKRPLDRAIKERLISACSDRGQYLAGKLQTGLPAISLSAHSGLITAVSNDIDANLMYAQQVIGFGNEGDVLIGISTSGNAQNVYDAIIAAKAKGLTVIGMTGATGGRIGPVCDILINVPEQRTSYVQELQLPVYHAICMMIETHIFG